MTPPTSPTPPTPPAGPPPEGPAQQEPPPEVPRADPRAAFRGPASAALTLEAIAVPLALLVMAKAEGGLTPLKVVWVVVLTVGMIGTIPVVRRPWGLGLAVGLQLLMLAGWVVSPALGALGVVFCLVWALMLWMRREVIRRQAAWPTA